MFICSVILGQVAAFRNYKGFSIIFPENFRRIMYKEIKNFFHSSFHRIFES